VLPTNLREPVLDAVSVLQMKIGPYIQTVLKNEETAQPSAGLSSGALTSFLSRAFPKQ